MSKIRESELVLNMNERLFTNALEGVNNKQASERLSDHSNPLSWIAGHTVHARYLMLMFLGKPGENPYNELFDNSRAYDPALKYPSLEDVKKEWSKVSGLLKDAVKSVTDEQLNGESAIKSPIGDNTNRGTLAFLAQHESYDIGQMGYLKKYFTGEAMKY
jgi:hypothetical protein